MSINVDFKFNNSYAEQLDGFYVPFIGDKAPAAKLVILNHNLVASLGLDLSTLTETEIAAIFSGGVQLKGAAPLAQAYAGHQFGGFSPQLGDGRALLLGEVFDRAGNRVDIQLKGSGRTSFSRGGDGKATLTSVLREYIVAEAMFNLNVPTTRALSAVITGENIYRQESVPGAVLARVAASHIRVGTFQYFAARDEMDKLKQLADYTISRHFSALENSDNRYLGLLKEVCERQAILVSKWMLLGFIHGVMNTDNMTISGETIDYGPCAFMEHYDPQTVFSSIDNQGRYAYANQPNMAQWNLTRLAETLLPLIHLDEDTSIRLATEEVNAFSSVYQKYWLEGMRLKLGLFTIEDKDADLANELLSIMKEHHVDFTLLFRNLSTTLDDDISVVQILFEHSSLDGKKSFYLWHLRWLERLSRESVVVDERIKSMNAVNPLYIPRNHMVEAALQAAEKEADFAPFEKLMLVLSEPYKYRENLEEYTQPAPKSFGHYQTFCGT